MRSSPLIFGARSQAAGRPISRWNARPIVSSGNQRNKINGPCCHAIVTEFVVSHPRRLARGSPAPRGDFSRRTASSAGGRGRWHDTKAFSRSNPGCRCIEASRNVLLHGGIEPGAPCTPSGPNDRFSAIFFCAMRGGRPTARRVGSRGSKARRRSAASDLRNSVARRRFPASCHGGESGEKARTAFPASSPRQRRRAWAPKVRLP